MHFRPVGERALLVEERDPDRLRGLRAALEARRAAGGIPAEARVLPGATTVLVDGVPDPRGLALELSRLRVPTRPVHHAGVVEVPVVYDGADLAEVADRWGVSPQEAARLHAGGDYVVAFCGFVPGFAYLAGLPNRLAVPRRATPRARVPAGAVGLAGTFTGVYPTATPGGWQLIGRTSLVLWDPERTPAALLTPDTRVRFREVAG